MIKIQKNIDIKEFTTFGVPAVCRYFTEVNTLEELKKAIEYSKKENLQILPIGGGSNVLFINIFEGLAIKINIEGITEQIEDEDYLYVSAYAGVCWDCFVSQCVSKNYGGLENLSLIPGRVGTSPMQNIGAYGVEIKDCFHSLKALNIETGNTEIFTKEKCNFGYRESYFKNEGKNKYIILEVTFLLTRKNHKINSEYGAIKEELIQRGVLVPTIKDIREVVKTIRESKLPNPKIYGNAGSFFKNPVITKEEFKKLEEEYPSIPHYKLVDGKVKIPAGWLVEQAGWKGRTIGKVGVHKEQALVLINLGGALGNDIYKLSLSIEEDVEKKFNIPLQREVNLIS